MKKLFLILYILLSGSAIFAQIDSGAVAGLVDTGLGIAVLAAGQAEWVPNVPNHAVAGIITAVVGFILHVIRVRRLKKKHDIK